MGGNKSLMGNAGLITDIDTSQRNPLGLEVPDEFGNVYVYAKGVASLAQGDWVVINSDYTTTRSLNTPLAGPVGVAMAAILANQFGWFQRVGLVNSTTAGNGATQSNIASDGSADKKPLFLTSTAGRLGTSVAAGCAVLGAWGSGAAASNVGAAWIARPHAPGFTLASA